MTKTIKAKKTPLKKFSVVELFCGCGGFSHGFHRTQKFDIICGVDVKKQALETFRKNHLDGAGTPPSIIEGDIREIEISDIQNILKKRGIEPDGLDCLIGGPPCQGFSQLRRSNERKQNKIVRFRGYDRLDQDPRNDLVLRFLEIAATLLPKIIIIENVPQMMRHVHDGVDGGLPILIKSLLEELEYEVEDDILNAADFGVPQIRQRALIIASRVGKLKFPKPTHAEIISGATKDKSPWVTVSEALSDLPSPPIGTIDTLGNGPLTLYKNSGSKYSKKIKSSKNFPYNHIARTYNERVIAISRNMRAGETWDEASERMRIQFEKKLLAEKTDKETTEQCRKRLIDSGDICEAFYKKYYWSAYTRLNPAQPALTITANANFLGSGRFTHPYEDRGITMREAARLQSFHDDFTLITSIDGRDLTTNPGIGLDMIGEAVPPLLSEAIANEALKLLNK